jgi:hypothetical protein
MPVLAGFLGALLALIFLVPSLAGAGAGAPTRGTVIALRKSTDYVTLGTSSSGCAANGATTSSATLTAGAWRMHVQGESVAICDGQDADCALVPMDFGPGYVEDLEITAAQTGTFKCRSAGGTGYVTFRKLN